MLTDPDEAVEVLAPVHTAQLLTYLRLTGRVIGLLINFNVPVAKDGIKRIVNRAGRTPASPASGG